MEEAITQQIAQTKAKVGTAAKAGKAKVLEAKVAEDSKERQRTAHGARVDMGKVARESSKAIAMRADSTDIPGGIAQARELAPEDKSGC